MGYERIRTFCSLGYINCTTSKILICAAGGEINLQVLSLPFQYKCIYYIYIYIYIYAIQNIFYVYVRTDLQQHLASIETFLVYTLYDNIVCKGVTAKP